MDNGIGNETDLTRIYSCGITKQHEWFYNMHFTEKDGKIQCFLFKLEFKQHVMGIVLPVKKLNVFDFFVYKEDNTKENSRISFIKELSLTRKELKNCYLFHTYLFADLIHISVAQIPQKTLAFDDIFMKTHTTPILIVVPLKEDSIDKLTISQIIQLRREGTYNNSGEVREGIIVQSKEGSRKLYYINKIIDNPFELTADEFFNILEDVFGMEKEEIKSLYNISGETDLTAIRFFDWFEEKQFTSGFINNLCKSFHQAVKNKLGLKERLLVMQDLKSCGSYKFNIKFKKLASELTARMKKPFPRLTFIKTVTPYVFSPEKISGLMALPAFISSFLTQSRILEFFEDFNLSYESKSSNFLQAFMTSKADSDFNLELMETVGDSVLKLMTVFYLFCKFDDYDEGQLTNLKGMMISNKFYSEIANQMNLHHYMIFETKPNDNHPLMLLNKYENRYFDFNRKNMSDCFEAIICAFFVNTNSLHSVFKWIINNTNIFLHNPNLYELKMEINRERAFKENEDCNPADEEEFVLLRDIFDEFKGGLVDSQWKKELFDNIFLYPIHQIDIELDIEIDYDIQLEQLLIESGVYNGCILDPLQRRRSVERVIGYQFKNSELLVIALNRKDPKFDRFEFFGDVLFEFMFVSIIGKACLKNSEWIAKPKQLANAKGILLSNRMMRNLMDLYTITAFLNHDELSGKEPEAITASMTVNEFLKRGLAKGTDNYEKSVSDVWEALCFAIFMDGGFEALKTSIIRLSAPFIAFYIQNHHKIKYKLQ